MANITNNSRGQVVINGSPRQLVGIYDAGFAGVGSSGYNAVLTHAQARNYTRYKLNLINQYTFGTFANELNLSNVLSDLGMTDCYYLVTANFFSGALFDPATFTPTQFSFDVYQNPTYTTTPEGTDTFQHLIPQKSQSFGHYVADEPGNNGQNWGRDDCVTLRNYLKSVNPTMPTWVTYLNDDTYRFLSSTQHSAGWSNFGIADYLGADIYVRGQNPEDHPGGVSATTSTYGYYTYGVAEAAALAAYHASRFQGSGAVASGASRRVPVIVLQLNKFGSASRFPTLSEFQSDFCIAQTEFRGGGVIVWWAMGTGNGALDQFQTCTFSGDGTTTVFNTHATTSGSNHLYAEEAGDVVVKLSNVTQTQGSQYTIQNLGDRTMQAETVGSNQFWFLANPLQITFVTPPPTGTNNIQITIPVWPTTKKNEALQFLQDACQWTYDYQSLITQTPDDSLIVNNSTWLASAIAWRKAHVAIVSNGAPDRPTWLSSKQQTYADENTRLNLATPDTTLSDHMLQNGQKGNVRTCAWSGTDYGIITAYNMNPNAQTNVQLTLSRAISSAEVWGENRFATVSANGLTITDTFGGASSLRQGTFNTGHIYKVLWADTSLPNFVSTGTVTDGLAAVQIPMPSGIIAGDGLVVAVRSFGPSGVVNSTTLTDAGGGTWTQQLPSHAGGTTRLDVWVSRYDGTQTAPTFQNTSAEHIQGVILAYRGVAATGSFVDAQGGGASNFTTTSDNISSITTVQNHCMIVDIMALGAPDSTSTSVFTFTNANLSNTAERVDQATTTGSGGALGISEGILAIAGATGTTAVSYPTGNSRNAYKKLALIPASDVPVAASSPPAAGIFRVGLASY